jgi:hypothetical protein
VVGKFSKNNFDLKSAYDELALDRKTINDYLLSKGVKQNEMFFLLLISRNSSKIIQIITGITFRMNLPDTIYATVSIESKEVAKIENLSKILRKSSTEE